jgi:hypothetical protein
MTGIAATPVVVECNSAKYCILLKTKIVGDDVIISLAHKCSSYRLIFAEVCKK